MSGSQSTSTITQAQHASTAISSTPITNKTTRIVASALLSRPPLILPLLTPLESTYYAYQRSISRALAKPLATSSAWFLKPNSPSEKTFTSFDAKVVKEMGQESQEELYAMGREGIEGASQLIERETQSDKAGEVRSLERKLDRTIYLLVKKDRKENNWQFPQGGVEANESLVQAASRELKEETGENMDVWSCGKVPAGAYSYDFPSSYTKTTHSSATVFFLPMRIIRGQAVPNKGEGLIDFAWVTKEEVQEKVSSDYWDAVEPMLSER